MRRVNAVGRLSRRARRSLPGLKREMRTLATAPEKVSPEDSTKETASRSETAKDSESGWEWEKGLCFPNDARARSHRRSLLPAFRNARGFCPSQEDQMASQPFPGK